MTGSVSYTPPKAGDPCRAGGQVKQEMPSNLPPFAAVYTPASRLFVRAHNSPREWRLGALVCEIRDAHSFVRSCVDGSWMAL